MSPSDGGAGACPRGARHRARQSAMSAIRRAATHRQLRHPHSFRRWPPHRHLHLGLYLPRNSARTRRPRWQAYLEKLRAGPASSRDWIGHDIGQARLASSPAFGECLSLKSSRIDPGLGRKPINFGDVFQFLLLLRPVAKQICALGSQIQAPSSSRLPAGTTNQATLI